MDATATQDGTGLEQRVAAWRDYLRRRRPIHADDSDELEDHLRAEIEALTDAGLAEDEAFLIAVKRIGALDELTREFAREHSERLWRQLVTGDSPGGGRAGKARTELLVVTGLAAGAALAVKAPALFGVPITDGNEGFYVTNASLFVLPFLAAYFAWKRRVAPAVPGIAAAAFAAAAILANSYPFVPGGMTNVLTVLHLPMALWLVIGLAYAGGKWRNGEERMNFVRFSGELFIYYVLIALGGGVLTMVTLFLFMAIGLDAETLVQTWTLPCGAAGAVIFASWLVEAKQSVIENMAPVLTRLFSPLFAAVMLAFLGTMAWTGSGIDLQREVLIGFDLLLVVVVGLLLYSVSARDPRAAPDLFDWVQLTLVIAALLVDAVALAEIAGRISEFGFSANKVAALGENLVLLVNLAGSAWLYARFLRSKAPFAALARWQTGYLPVYSAWAAVVALAFPPLFGYV